MLSITRGELFPPSDSLRSTRFSPRLARDSQVLNQELEEANSVLKIKRNEVQRIEEEVALLMQVPHRCA